MEKWIWRQFVLYGRIQTKCSIPWLYKDNIPTLYYLVNFFLPAATPIKENLFEIGNIFKEQTCIRIWNIICFFFVSVCSYCVKTDYLLGRHPWVETHYLQLLSDSHLEMASLTLWNKYNLLYNIFGSCESVFLLDPPPPLVRVSNAVCELPCIHESLRIHSLFFFRCGGIRVDRASRSLDARWLMV